MDDIRSLSDSVRLVVQFVAMLLLLRQFMLKLGIFALGDEKGLYTYCLGGNWLFLFVYVLFAIATSIGILYGAKRAMEGMRRSK